MLTQTLRGLTQKHAPSLVKQWLWNREFAAGRHANLGTGACQHPEVERYAHNGHVLDLGCGPGRTGLELTGIASYLGVDISSVAVDDARARAIGRPEIQYAQGDLLTFTPERLYDVILLGDSLYYVPLALVASVIRTYAKSLTPTGVIIVRVCDPTGRYAPLLALVRHTLTVTHESATINDQGVPVHVLIAH